MGVASSLGMAFYKAQLSAGNRLPTEGTVLITVNKRDHLDVVPIARRLAELGFKILATKGTARKLREAEIEVEEVLKKSEGRPNCIDAIKSGEIDLVINTPLGASSFRDGIEIRTAAVQHNVPCITTLSGAEAATEAILALHEEPELSVCSLQEIHGRA